MPPAEVVVKFDTKEKEPGETLLSPNEEGIHKRDCE
jgi:hypothetical protein